MTPGRDELPWCRSTEPSFRGIGLREALTAAALQDTLPDHAVAVRLRPSRVETSAEAA